MANFQSKYDYSDEATLIKDYGEKWPDKWKSKRLGNDDFDGKAAAYGDCTSKGFSSEHLLDFDISKYGLATKRTIRVNKIIYELLDSVFHEIAKLKFYEIRIVWGHLFRYKKSASNRTNIQNGSDYEVVKKWLVDERGIPQADIDTYWNKHWAEMAAIYDSGHNRLKKAELSNHSFGTAIDINSPENDFGSKVWDMPPEIVKIFLAHGFAWGGFFQTKDAMHFEYLINGSMAVPPQLTHLSMPMDIILDSTFTRNNLDKIYSITENEQSSGFFPVGANTVWHGGLHLERTVKTPIYSVAAGRIICARLDKKGANNLKNGSRNFVLIEHKQEDGTKWYSLYMHLLSVDFNAENFHTQRLKWLLDREEIKNSVQVKAGYIKRSGPSQSSQSLGGTSTGAVYIKLGQEGSWIHLKDEEEKEFYITQNGVIGDVTGYKKIIKKSAEENPGEVLQLNHPVIPGEIIGYMGEFGISSNRKPMVHWEIFSEKLIGTGWKTATDNDSDYACDSDEIIKLIDSASGLKTGELDAQEIINFYRDTERSKKVREYACKFISEWGVDWEAALQKLGTKFKIVDGVNAEDLKPYVFWDSAKAKGVELPSSKLVYHYNPIRFLERLAPPLKSVEETIVSPDVTFPFKKGDYDDVGVQNYPSKKVAGAGYKEGTPIHDIQKMLDEFGFDQVWKADGDYGKKTEAAVRDFQRAACTDVRLVDESDEIVEITFKGEVTGKVDSDTYAEIEYWKKMNYRVAIGMYGPISTVALPYYNGEYDDVAVEKYIKPEIPFMGYREGSDIYKIQSYLQKFGFSQVGNADGDFGPKTLEAVIEFQEISNEPYRQQNGQKIEVETGEPLITTGEVDFFTVMEMNHWLEMNYKKPEAPCDCLAPQENFPYSDDTFALIESLSELINFYSTKYDVPPVAVAGSIADEYNTRTGAKAVVDWIQDEVLLDFMPNFAIEVDAYFGFQSKLLNATKHDIGLGNIKIETAKEIYEQYPQEFENKNMDYSDIVDYIMSNEGTVHMAALVIRKAKKIFEFDVLDKPQGDVEAIYVTYYKQGDSYVDRYNAKKLTDPSHDLKPGEGCRVCLQREKFLNILSP